MIDLKDVFQGGLVPAWLLRFQNEPDAALEDLLVGGADLGPLNAEEPASVLLDWLEGLGSRSDFPLQVDEALARWIDRSWGNPTLEAAASSATLTGMAWSRAADVIAVDERLDRAAASLCVKVLADRVFLNGLTEGRARDPQGRAWLALARHQRDRILIDQWWRLCRLPPDEAWYRGPYGIHGLRGVPASKESIAAGGFPSEVAEGLAVLAAALAHRQEQGYLEARLAQEEFLRIARLTMAAYPFPEAWQSFWHEAVDAPRSKVPRTWIEKLPRLTPPRRPRLGHGPPAPSRVRPDPSWRDRIHEIAARLRRGDGNAVPPAQSLLDSQGAYARVTGDTYYVVRSAGYFAAAVRQHSPDLTVTWADLARDFDPWNAHAWTTGAAGLLALGNHESALRRALHAVTRFPSDAAARNGLAEVLKAKDRLNEAEAVYRETLGRFPGNLFARTGLADVLKARERLDEAEAAYREAVTCFPDNVVARCGLADVLKARDRLDEAEAVYREAVTRFPDNVVARCGLADVLKDQNRLEEAEAVYREAVDRFSNDVVARNGLAGVLKAQDRLDESEAVYRETLSRWPNNEYAQTGLRSVLKALENGEHAAAIEPAPASPQRPPKTAPRHLAEAASPPEAPDVPLAEVGFERGLGEDDVAILLSDAYLLRRWGGLRQRVEAAAATGALREQARELLDRLARFSKSSSQAASEMGLLYLGENDLKAAVDLLREAAERFHGSVRVRYALARAERELALREQLRLEAGTEQRLILPWHQLSRLDQHCRPVSLLGAGRAWLALSDGDYVEHHARDVFLRLDTWVDKHALPIRDEPDTPALDVAEEGFGSDDESGEHPRRRPEAVPLIPWWAGEVRRHLFGGEPLARAEDIIDLAPLRERVRTNADLLNRLEEDLVYCYARA